MNKRTCSSAKWLFRCVLHIHLRVINKMYQCGWCFGLSFSFFSSTRIRITIIITFLYSFFFLSILLSACLPSATAVAVFIFDILLNHSFNAQYCIHIHICIHSLIHFKGLNFFSLVLIISHFVRVRVCFYVFNFSFTFFVYLFTPLFRNFIHYNYSHSHSIWTR